MTYAQKLKKMFMLLRWYDSYVKDFKSADEVPEEDVRLALEIERDMHEVQTKLNAVKKEKKKCKKKVKTTS